MKDILAQMAARTANIAKEGATLQKALDSGLKQTSRNLGGRNQCAQVKKVKEVIVEEPDSDSDMDIPAFTFGPGT
jgi:hypothetical protein